MMYSKDPRKEDLVRVTSDQIQAAIIKSIRTVAPSTSDLGPQTALAGQQASLDSVGFLTFLVTLEGELGNRIDLAALLQNTGSTGEDGLFGTIGSLTAFIAQRLNEHS
jgi:hypothetical protein